MTDLQNRRDFLKTTAAAAGALSLGLTGTSSCAGGGGPPAPMTILLSPYDPDVEEGLAIAIEAQKRYRGALRELAK